MRGDLLYDKLIIVGDQIHYLFICIWNFDDVFIVGFTFLLLSPLVQFFVDTVHIY